MDALSIIELHKESYTARELEVYEAVKSHPEDVLGSTATEFSAAHGFSQSAVSRFCKRAGFEGYGEFRMAMNQAVYSRGLENLATGEMSFSTDIGGLCRLIEESVSNEELDLLVSRICAAEHIFLLGKGASSIAARALALVLLLRSLPATLVETGWEEEYLHRASSKDVYIIFSAKNPSYKGFLSTVVGLRADSKPFVSLISLTDHHPLRGYVDQCLVLPRNPPAGGAYLDSFLSATLFSELIADELRAQHPASFR